MWIRIILYLCIPISPLGLKRWLTYKQNHGPPLPQLAKWGVVDLNFYVEFISV
jgi:hypothetical protein